MGKTAKEIIIVISILVILVSIFVFKVLNDLKAKNEMLKVELSTYTNIDNNISECTTLSNIKTTDPEKSSPTIALNIIDLLYEFKDWDGKKTPGKAIYTLNLDNDTYLLSIFCDSDDTTRIDWMDIHYYKELDSSYTITSKELEPFEKLALLILGDNAAESEWKDKILSGSFPYEEIVGDWALKMNYYIYQEKKAGIYLAFYNQNETINKDKVQIANPTDPPKRNYSSGSIKEDKISAWVFAQDAVKENLKAPSTAKFPWYDESYISVLDDGRYFVKAYVDAQNSFGAKIRSHFSVKIRITGENSYTFAELIIN